VAPLLACTFAWKARLLPRLGIFVAKELYVCPSYNTGTDPIENVVHLHSCVHDYHGNIVTLVIMIHNNHSWKLGLIKTNTVGQKGIDEARVQYFPSVLIYYFREFINYE
jgi:hypothetical protein